MTTIEQSRKAVSESLFIPLSNTVCVNCTDSGSATKTQNLCSPVSCHIIFTFSWLFHTSWTDSFCIWRVSCCQSVSNYSVRQENHFLHWLSADQFSVVLIPSSRSVSKSWKAFQACFKFCVCAALPGRDPNWSPQSWFESCSPRGSTQDLDSQTEDTWLPEKAEQNKSDLTLDHLHFF